jgi:hypothetical protein
MDMQNNTQDTLIENKADIELSKPTKSRFLFLLFFFCFFIFSWAGCYNVWEHRFKDNAAENTPKSSLYQPEYK